jgi:hypothetical protein
MRPSHKNEGVHPKLIKAMALRVPWAPVTPVLYWAGSEKLWAGKWHDPHDMLRSLLKAVSQNNMRPSFTPSTVKGLSAGTSIGGKKGGMTKSYGVGDHTGSSGPQSHPANDQVATTIQIHVFLPSMLTSGSKLGGTT